MTGIAHCQKHCFIQGCLIALVFIIILTLTAVMSWSMYWYRQDNAARRDPLENLSQFHIELQAYLSAHEGVFPAGKGAEGLGELVPYLPYLRVKDDKNVEIDPDIFTEHHSSYAYIASGLSQKDLKCEMPIIFEKPWNRKKIRILLNDGHIEELECNNMMSCRKVVEYYVGRLKDDSPAWDVLLRNAEEIDEK